MKPGGLFSKLFMGPYFFTIALREKTPRGIMGNRPFHARMILPATKNDWAADPMLVDDGDRSWLFYEAVKRGKGRIEAAEVLPGCRLSAPTVILEDACHYSYPFVFRAQGEWYLIPESSAAGEVRLYRATAFPFQWELQTVLLREAAVDTTVFEHKGCYWLLTFVLDKCSERVFPLAYTLTDWRDPELKEVPWPDYDPLQVRGAGPVFRDGDRLLRPAQISREHRYGDGLVLYEIEPTDRFRETYVSELSEKDLKARGFWVDGLHTYSACSRYEAIDLRCREADPWKLFRRITHYREKKMDIDFVVLWVDGNDPEWQAEKSKYQSGVTDDSNAANRFRDWGLMPYWFRAAEQFAPWVRKIHFVTWGHVPAWLNLDHPKLHHVRHEDYIPAEYLPTFSANTIEMNIHRIPGLAEHFVFFNDDMFMLRPMQERDFFRDGLPCSCGSEVPVRFIGAPGIWQHLIPNDMRVVNNHFSKQVQLRTLRGKFVNRAYRWQDNVRTRILERLYPESFLGFRNLHAPAAFRRQTFEELWREEHALMDQTCRNRFRTSTDVNQWLAIWWQLASGAFAPYAVDNVVEDVTASSIDALCRMIVRQGHDMLCVNDPSEDVDFELLSGRLKGAFEQILPNKSGFERER